MTREHKLALLIGFALVLIVGVVVSDHFSGARSARLGEVVDEREEGRRPIGGGLTTHAELLASEPLPAPHGVNEVPLTQPQIDQERIAERDRPVSGHEALAGAVKATIGRIPIIEMGAAPVTAQTDRRRDPEAASELMEEALSDEPLVTPMNWRPARTWPDPAQHQVQAGDTLWKIAEQRYGDPTLHTRLAEYNRRRLNSDGHPRVGATLLIPVREELVAGGEAPTATTRATATPDRSSTEAAARRHTVQRGETLGEISQKLLGTARRWREIHELNRDVIDNPDHVPAGVVLRIPAR